MKTTVDIPDSLFQEARTWAESHGVTFRHVVEEGLRSVIRTKEKPRHFRLRDGSFGERGRGVNLRWATTRAAIYEGRGE
jgi:hypothetical protein